MGSGDSATGLSLAGLTLPGVSLVVLAPAPPELPVKGQIGSPDSESASQSKPRRDRRTRRNPGEDLDEAVAPSSDILSNSGGSDNKNTINNDIDFDIDDDIEPVSHRLDRLA